jgi:rhodanese-related sulfurtransferase
VARIGKALSSPKRLELLDLLAQAPRTVEVLAEITSLSMANASQHLRVLRSAELVDADKKGSYVEYRLADESIAFVLLTLRSLAEDRLAAMQRLAREHLGADEDNELMRAELVSSVQGGTAIVLDVRPIEEYSSGHLPGAICIPLKELRGRIGELKKSSKVIVYCRGPYCLMAREAVLLLKRRGYRAFHLDLGVVDWRARGLEVERPSDA